MSIAQPGVVEAQIRRLGGFDIFETVILSENGEKLVGFAAHPSGLGSPILQPPLFPSTASAVAMRYLEPVAEYDEAGAVTDPECFARKRSRYVSRSGLCIAAGAANGPHLRLPALHRMHRAAALSYKRGAHSA